MSQYTTYEEFLNHSYRKILEACLADQAIDTLKILENKDYLLLRVNELFSEIYVAERERTIQEQANLISTLQKTQQGSKKKEEKCLNCELMGEHVNDLETQLRQLERKINTNVSAEEKSVKKIESMLLKEVEQLKRDLKEIQEENLFKKVEFEDEIEKYLDENRKLKSLLKEETEKSQKLFEKLRARVKQIEQEKQNLEDQVFSQLQSRGKEEKDIRQLNSKCTNLMITRQRQQGQITLIKNQNNILQEKLKRLEEENKFVKDKNSIAERQIKSLKKTIESIQQECEKLKGEIQENAVTKEPYSLQSINKKSEIQRRNQESEKYIQALKQELAQKQAQFSEATVQNEKTILKLNDELRKAQIKMEKQLRNAKEEHKRVLFKETEELEAARKQLREEITKRYEKSLEEMEKKYQKSQEKIAALDRALTESQQSSNDAFKEFQQEKARLVKQIQQQKHNFMELKKYYNSQKVTEELIEKENVDKYDELMTEKREIEKIILLKEKQIRDYKKEILKLNELQSSLLVKIEDYKNKLANALRNSEEQRTKSKSFAQKLRQKEKSYHDIQIKYTDLLEESQEADKKLATFAVNERRLEEKIRRLENQLAQKRQLLLSMQEANQQQVIDVFAKAQQTTSQTRKQLESYYLNLLKTSEERNSKASSQEVERLQEEELTRMKIKAEDCQEKLKRYRQKNLEEQKQKANNQTKIYALLQENQQLKSENSKVLEIVHNEKKKNLGIIKAYQEKMLDYYNNFGQFKREFYLSLKEELTLVKAELVQIGQAAKLQKVKFQQYISDFSEKMLRESQILAQKHQIELEKLKHQYEYNRILKIEQEKRELKGQCEIRLKQQSMEFYTIMAEKEHLINNLTQKESKLQKKVSELDLKNDQLEKISRETFKKNQELKEIISKMSSKIAQSDRTCSSLLGQLDFYKRSNIELKKQISQLETTFKEKIEECREKYSAQNQRLFAKYEKEFSKFIVSNKKSLEFSMLSNSCSNLHVPTKGAPEGKLDKIQRQIQEQKKKLNLLEKDGKFDKTKKLVVERDQPRNEKQRKY